MALRTLTSFWRPFGLAWLRAPLGEKEGLDWEYSSGWNVVRDNAYQFRYILKITSSEIFVCEVMNWCIQCATKCCEQQCSNNPFESVMKHLLSSSTIYNRSIFRHGMAQQYDFQQRPRCNQFQSTFWLCFWQIFFGRMWKEERKLSHSYLCSYYVAALEVSVSHVWFTYLWGFLS